MHRDFFDEPGFVGHFTILTDKEYRTLCVDPLRKRLKLFE